MSTMSLTYQFIKIQADGRTPVQVFRNLTGKRFLLESTSTHEKKGKFSFLGMDPYREVIGRKGETRVIDLTTGDNEMMQINALDYMKNYFPSIEINLPVPFYGGAVGYVGYDAIREFIPQL